MQNKQKLNPTMAGAQKDAIKAFEQLEKSTQAILNNNPNNNKHLLPPHLKKDNVPATVQEDFIAFNRIEQEYDSYMQSMLKKNRCSASEYSSKWLLFHQIFEHSGYATEEEYARARAALSNEYVQRFSPQHPVTIYDDNDPNRILAVIPPMFRPLNAIRGYDASYVDQFIKFSDHDRMDIRNSAQSGLNQAVINAQKMDEENFNKVRANVNAAGMKVLQVFAPNHPLLKLHEQHTAQENSSTNENSSQQTNNVQGPNDVQKEPGTLVIEDISEDDLGL